MRFHINIGLYKLLSLLLLNSLKLIVCLSVFDWISFRGKTQLKPHPDWYLLGVQLQLKLSDGHPRTFYMGAPPPGKNIILMIEKVIVKVFCNNKWIEKCM